MYIITSKQNDTVVGFGRKIHYNGASGYPCLTEEGLFFPAEQVKVHEVKNIPQTLSAWNWKFDGQNFSEIIIDENPVIEEEEEDIEVEEEISETEEEEIEAEEIPTTEE